MKPCPRCCLAIALAACLTSAAAQTATVYRGPCDASAAVALDAEHFVVGDDEHNLSLIHI